MTRPSSGKLVEFFGSSWCTATEVPILNGVNTMAGWIEASGQNVIHSATSRSAAA
jgi:hypothetical protein